MMINIKELLLNPCFPFNKIKPYPMMGFYSITPEFSWVMVLILLKRARLLSELGGMFMHVNLNFNI